MWTTAGVSPHWLVFDQVFISNLQVFSHYISTTVFIIILQCKQIIRVIEHQNQVVMNIKYGKRLKRSSMGFELRVCKSSEKACIWHWLCDAGARGSHLVGAEPCAGGSGSAGQGHQRPRHPAWGHRAGQNKVSFQGQDLTQLSASLILN